VRGMMAIATNSALQIWIIRFARASLMGSNLLLRLATALLITCVVLKNEAEEIYE
jgi:hypothetical protein